MRVLPLAIALAIGFSQTAWAFCGFYVATGPESLTNKSSRVVLAHTDNSTTVTMASDVGGDPKQFALVIPVPTTIRRDQVRIVNPDTVAHLADYTKPRLVQYFDPDPCPPEPYRQSFWDRLFGLGNPSVFMSAVPAPAPMPSSVHIEAKFSIDEYDIIILSATDSGDLLTFLNRSGYKTPAGARDVVGSYLKQHMHFFLAKVNMARMKGNNSGFLRPIQVEYKSPKFMLPVRLGTVNATGPQDMIVMTLTQKGRVETTNYRTQRMPSGVNVPVYVQTRFAAFYDAVFNKQFAASGGNSVFLEYAWNMNACDPCSAARMDNSELRALGATWLPEGGWQQSVFVTRMHVRYDSAHFPEDLMLQETPDQESYQARFVVQAPFAGDRSCAAGQAYEAMLPKRFAAEAATLAQVSGWDPASIKADMAKAGQVFP